MYNLRTIAIIEKKSLADRISEQFDKLTIEEYSDAAGYHAHIKAPIDFYDIFLVTSLIEMDAESDGWSKGYNAAPKF